MYEFWYIRVLNYEVIEHVNMRKSCNHMWQYLRWCQRWHWYQYFAIVGIGETTVSEDLHQSRQAGNSHFQALRTSRRGNGTAWRGYVVHNARLPTCPQTSTSEAWHSSEGININSDASWAPTSGACACGTYISHVNGTRGKFAKLVWSYLLVGSLTIP
jgi:hypothetical protein